MNGSDLSKYVLWSTLELLDEIKKLDQQKDGAAYSEVSRILNLRKDTVVYQFATGKKWHVETSKQLPVYKIIKEVFARIHEKWFEYVQALAPVIIISILIDVAGILYLKQYKYLAMLVIPLYGLTSTLVAVTCHRLIALGADSIPRWGIIKPTYREWRFYGFIFCFGLAYGVWSAIVGLPVGLILSKMDCCALKQYTILYGIAFYILLIPVLIYVSRFSMVLPAVAVDQWPDYTWAMEITKGNAWRVFFVVSFFPAVFLCGIPQLVHELKYFNEQSIWLQIPYVLYDQLFIIIEISVLTLTYMFLREDGVFLGKDEWIKQ